MLTILRTSAHSKGREEIGLWIALFESTRKLSRVFVGSVSSKSICLLLFLLLCKVNDDTLLPFTRRSRLDSRVQDAECTYNI